MPTFHARFLSGSHAAGLSTGFAFGVRRLARWWHAPRGSSQALERGMTTAEYAVGTVAACGFAGLLFKIVTSSKVQSMLTDTVQRALELPF